MLLYNFVLLNQLLSLRTIVYLNRDIIYVSTITIQGTKIYYYNYIWMHKFFLAP